MTEEAELLLSKMLQLMTVGGFFSRSCLVAFAYVLISDGRMKTTAQDKGNGCMSELHLSDAQRHTLTRYADLLYFAYAEIDI